MSIPKLTIYPGQIGILVSPTDPSLNLASTAAKSPFVIAIKVSFSGPGPGSIRFCRTQVSLFCRPSLMLRSSPAPGQRAWPISTCPHVHSTVYSRGVMLPEYLGKPERWMAYRGSVWLSVRHSLCFPSWRRIKDILPGLSSDIVSVFRCIRLGRWKQT